MRRVLGVLAVLAAVGCGSSAEPDLGVMPEMPMLEPLELRRTATGNRLAARYWRLPDGTREEQLEMRLLDRGLDTLCTPVDGERTLTGDLRCVPSTNLALLSTVALEGRFADDDCSALAFTPRPETCPPRFVTEVRGSDLDARWRVYFDTDDTTDQLFRRSGDDCVEGDPPAADPWVVAAPLADASMAGGERSRVVMGDEAEVTFTFDDGTIQVTRERAEACQPIPAQGADAAASVQCVAGFLGGQPGIEPAPRFADDRCTQPVLVMTQDAWDGLDDSGENRAHAILSRFGAGRETVIQPVVSDPEMLDGVTYALGPDDECREIDFEPVLGGSPRRSGAGERLPDAAPRRDRGRAPRAGPLGRRGRRRLPARRRLRPAVRRPRPRAGLHAERDDRRPPLPARPRPGAGGGLPLPAVRRRHLRRAPGARPGGRRRLGLRAGRGGRLHHRRRRDHAGRDDAPGRARLGGRRAARRRPGSSPCSREMPARRPSLPSVTAMCCAGEARKSRSRCSPRSSWSWSDVHASDLRDPRDRPELTGGGSSSAVTPMLRAMGVVAALMLLSCGRSAEGTDADVGPEPLDVGPPEVPRDEGPVIVEPELESLELERSTGGPRLESFAWRLPDGSLRELTDLRWFDRELGVECAEVEADRNDSGRLRCMPSLTESIEANVFGDESCERFAVRPLPACTSPRFPRLASVDGTVRVFRPTGQRTSMLYGITAPDDECTLARDNLGAPWLRLERIPEAEMVGGEESVRAVSPHVLERTRRFDDGSTVIQRVTREPCFTMIADDESERFCVPAFFSVAGEGALVFTDPDCRDLAFPFTEQQWARVEIDGRSQTHLLVFRDATPVVRPVLSPPEPAVTTPFALDEDGACLPSNLAVTSIIRLGEEVPLTEFPRLRFVQRGERRLRVEHLVDDDGIAWPQLSSSVFLDVDLGAQCSATPTADGTRCLPHPNSARLASGSSSSMARGSLFADDACTIPVAEAPEAERFIYTQPFEQPCEETRPSGPRLELAVTAIRELGVPLDADDPLFVWDVGDQACVQGESTPRPGTVYRPVGAEVLPSAFAPLELVRD